MCLRLQPYVPEATWIGPASPRRPTRATRATPTRARSAGLRCLAPSARGVPAASSRTSRCAVCMSTRHMARPEYCSPACWKVASWCLPPPRGTPAHLGRTRRVLGGSAHRRARAAQVSTRGCGATARARHRLRLLHWLSMRRLGSAEMPMRGLSFEDVVVHPACRSAEYSPRWALPFETTFARLPPSVAADGYVRRWFRVESPISRGRPSAGCVVPAGRPPSSLG